VSNALFFQHAWLPSGWARDVRIEVSGGRITAVTPDSVPGDAARHGIALPGMPNLHSHSFQRAISGLTEYHAGGAGAENFWSWREVMYRFALRLSPEQIEAIATLAFIEMLESGFTTVAEFHYLHHAPDGAPYDNIAEMAERIAAAAQTAGISVLLLPVFYAHGGFGGAPANAGQRRFLNDLDSYERLFHACEKLAPTGVAPHSLRAVTPEELQVLTALAGERPVHIHIAEQTGEVDDCLAWCGARPIEFLLGSAPVGLNWCLVHATHATPAELAGMAAAGAVAGLCPITEANLGDGIFPAEHFNGAYGVGSDSNVLIDVMQELRMLEYSQRLGQRQRNAMAISSVPHTATALYAQALAGGAQACGLVAVLQPGAPADFLALPAAPDPDIALAQAVFGNRRGVALDVWAQGVQVVTNGHHAGAERARARFERVVAALTA
jgi:formiminoglutamate deiminase